MCVSVCVRASVRAWGSVVVGIVVVVVVVVALVYVASALTSCERRVSVHLDGVLDQGKNARAPSSLRRATGTSLFFSFFLLSPTSNGVKATREREAEPIRN